jgi:hypothetical protein
MIKAMELRNFSPRTLSKLSFSITMPCPKANTRLDMAPNNRVEQTACRYRFYVKAVPACNFFGAAAHRRRWVPKKVGTINNDIEVGLLE